MVDALGGEQSVTEQNAGQTLPKGSRLLGCFPKRRLVNLLIYTDL